MTIPRPRAQRRKKPLKKDPLAVDVGFEARYTAATTHDGGGER